MSTEAIIFSAGSLLIAVISLLTTFRRNQKGDRRLSKEEIRAEAHKEATMNAKLDAIGSSVQEIKLSIKPIAEKVSYHDMKFVKVEGDIQALTARLDQHLQTHPPNIGTLRRARSTQQEGE